MESNQNLNDIDVSQMTKKQLKNKLRKAGWDLKGNRPELIHHYPNLLSNVDDIMCELDSESDADANKSDSVEDCNFDSVSDGRGIESHENEEEGQPPTPKENKVQPLAAIPEVSITKVIFDCEVNESNYIEIIKKYVNEYNVKHELEGSKQYGIVDDDASNTLFSLLIYRQIATDSSKVLKPFLQDLSNYQETKYNIAIFYYCEKNAIYALTTNAAWRLIQSIRDCEFSRKIAKRLLDEKGMKAFGINPLYSKVAKCDESRKAGGEHRTDPIDEPNILTNFQARLRKNASIRRLNCFAKKGNVINVGIKLGSVRFQSNLRTETFPIFIEHLNRIDQGLPTYVYGTENLIEEDTDAFKSYTEKVKPSLKVDLDTLVCNSFKNHIQGVDNHFASNFSMMHRETTAFLNATKFRIHVGKEKFDIDLPPTLEEVLKFISDEQNSAFENIRNVEDIEGECPNFLNELNRIEISFNCGSRRIKQPLYNYVEGIASKDGEVYYRANGGEWYSSSKDYFAAVHNRTIDCLNMPTGSCSTQLTEVWKDKVDEDKYNDLYHSIPNFVVGDECLTTTMELFDLLHHDPVKKITYLYFVKKGFNNAARIAQEQLCNAILVITNHFRNINRSILENLHNKIQKRYLSRYKREMPEFCDTFKKFESLFDRTILREINFVYAVKSCSNFTYGKLNNKNLNSEKRLKVRIKVTDLELKLNALIQGKIEQLTVELKPDGIAYLSQTIFDQLVKEEFVVNSDGENGWVSSLLIWADRTNFKYSKESTEECDDIIFDMLLEYRTCFKSLSAKLSVDKMRAAVEKHKKFKFRIFDLKLIKDNKSKLATSKTVEGNKRKSTESNKSEPIAKKMKTNKNPSSEQFLPLTLKEPSPEEVEELKKEKKTNGEKSIIDTKPE